MSNDALRTILPIAGWSEDRARGVEITGAADPILPTPFRIGETSAAALAAVGLAVSEVWQVRTGRRQDVAVDTRQATASLRSGHYMKMDGAAVSTERDIKLITQANRAQSATAAQLVSQIADIRRITERNAEGVRQTRGGTAALLKQAETLSGIMDDAFSKATNGHNGRGR